MRQVLANLLGKRTGARRRTRSGARARRGGTYRLAGRGERLDGRMMITLTMADGTDVRAFDEGHGPVILIVHPGFDDGKSWGKVAARLSGRFRVVRIVRRQYRLDRPAPVPYSIAREAEDVLALAADIGQPMVIVGHSSGGVVALEALAAAPAAAFAGAVLFEPPVAIGPPPRDQAPGDQAPGAEGHGSEAADGKTPEGEPLDRARAAVAAGKPGKAMQIFVRDVVGMPAPYAWAVRPLVAVIPRLRALAPRQISDLDGVGPRLDVYARIETPTVLLGGERSPAHLGERLDALAAVMPHAEKVVLARRDHSAHLKAPDEVARVIETLAARVLP
jgi:pimeloyl-ACP methyl ester carboxylesterase